VVTRIVIDAGSGAGEPAGVAPARIYELDRGRIYVAHTDRSSGGRIGAAVLQRPLLAVVGQIAVQAAACGRAVSAGLLQRQR
jgi:hypothetical protein